MFKTYTVSLSLAACLSLHCLAEDASSETADSGVFRQTAVRQMSVDYGAPIEAVESPAGVLPNEAFQGEPVPEWIWGASQNQRYVVRTEVDVKTVQSARLMASCDNVGEIFINGKSVIRSRNWQSPMKAEITGHIRPGRNIIHAVIENQGGVAGFILKAGILRADDSVQWIVSDGTWKVDSASDGAFTDAVTTHGKLGQSPWGDIFGQDASKHTGRVPRDVFEVQPGFRVDRLFDVPKETLGSWVCITFDNQGRLLASDQGDRGLCRITLPPPGDEAGAIQVEHLSFAGCDVQPTSAQGMLYAFDSLYLSINGGPGSGLYRARDTDGDDQFDECVLLRRLKGRGEHGPHALRLSPDGQRIFLIAGNHTDTPFRAGEDLENNDYSSRIPTNWAEDLLLPRMWDAHGHARGRLAPGGWVASTDPDGKTWQIWSIGYRNPYDMAFNGDGQLFVYDADMEWDVGSPWYRPTRVVHATSGSEFGWRSGTGKWPVYYHDSLPPLVNIGPGSPVGVDFGYGLRFPAKYQKALYICDWTFGTMYAIHMTPNGSSYVAQKEEFVSRTPLPLTDVAAGPDGALYFTIGGRGADSSLFRVTYEGEESTGPASVRNDAFAADRRMRRDVEALHGRSFEFDDFVSILQSAREDGLPVDRLNARNGDRATVNALRRVGQNPALSQYLLETLQNEESTAGEHLEAITSLARGVGRNGLDAADVRRHSIAKLDTLDFTALNVTEQLKYLRCLTLIWTRLDAPSESERLRFLARLDSHFPSAETRLNRELCQTLVYLKSAEVVRKAIELLQQEAQREEIDMGDLLNRNSGYGSAINAMIANQPDRNQIWYAFCLRVAEFGWTDELRADYFRWFSTTRQWAGGHSFSKFLQNIENEFWNRMTENQRLMVEAAGARTPYRAPELPKPQGPGKEWSLDEVRSVAAEGLRDRDFENGEKMFAATRCVLCHRFAGRGAATGPDLTQLAGRFNVKDLTEAIVDPGRVVSDQYKASNIVTVDGTTISGRIVSESDSQISVLTNPEDSTKVVDVALEDIEELSPSATSLMPNGLLNRLNQNEVLDLLAYLLSRGDSKDAMFRQKE